MRRFSLSAPTNHAAYSSGPATDTTSTHVGVCESEPEASMGSTAVAATAKKPHRAGNSTNASG